MKITGTIWLDSVVEKIEAKQGVSREEVHQVVRSQAMFRFVEMGIVVASMSTPLWDRPGPADI